MEAVKRSAGLSRFKPKQGMIPAFIVGLILGPIALSYLGVTVTSRSARAALNESTLELKADVCAAKAKGSGAEVAKLDANGRRDLAGKFAATQGNGYADYEIVNLCANKLSD